WVGCGRILLWGGKEASAVKRSRHGGLWQKPAL
ncbi:MAG: hypothetical protein ACI8R4_003005, partial [Paracoccaceae bacterium]